MDRSWRLPWKRLDLDRLREAAQAIARQHEGVTARAEAEGGDCLSCWFELTGAERAVVEIAIYDMDRDGILLVLEADAADNLRLGEDADVLAEDLAEALEGEPFDL